MTFIEAKDFLEKKYFSDCKTAEDCQKVVGQYAIDTFGEKNARKCIDKLKKIQVKHQRRNPEPTPEAITAIVNDFGAYVKSHKYAQDTFNPMQLYIMTVIAAQLSEKL